MGDSFGEWILKQRERGDQIGAFASIAALCVQWTPFPEPDLFTAWRDYFLYDRGLHTSTMRAFENAWREWQDLKQIEEAVAG